MARIRNLNPISEILLLVIIGLALWLRLTGLSWGLPNARHSDSYMPDENNWISIISRMEPSKFDFNPHYLVVPTFHLYLVGAGMKIADIFNYVKIPHERGNSFSLNYPNEYAKLFLIGRLFSVAMGVMTILLVYLVGREMYSKTVGITASLLFSVIPSHIIQSHFFNGNTAVTFWIILSFYFMIKILQSGKTRWYMMSGITSGLAMSTKYTALLLVFPLAAAHCLYENDRFKPKDIIISLFSRRLFMAYIFFVIFFLIGSPYTIFSWRDFVSGISFVHQLGFETSARIIDLLRPMRVILYGIGLPLAILGSVGLILLIKRRLKNDILILAWVIPFYLISLRMVYYVTDSRLVPLTPFLSLSAAVLLFQNTKTQLLKRYFSVAVAAALFVYNLVFSLAVNSRFQGEDIQDRASDWILKNISAGTKIGYETIPYWWAPYIHYSPTDHSLLKRYQLAVCEWDKDILIRESPAYFIATDFTFHKIPEKGEDLQRYQNFREYLRDNYRMVKQFTKEFNFKWFNVSIETRPDMGSAVDIYYQPIYILKLKDLIDGDGA